MQSRRASGSGPGALPAQLATSAQLGAILESAGGARVPVGWLIERLGERSFGVTLLAMGLLALVPGASAIVGVLIAWPAIQLALGHRAPVLPRLFARRTIAMDKLERPLQIVLPRLRWVEALVRPRWSAGFRAARRPAGMVVLLLGMTLISPLPFSHVVPALVIMLLALAYLEQDGVVLLIALIAAAASLAGTAAALWGAVETAGWLGRLWPA